MNFRVQFNLDFRRFYTLTSRLKVRCTLGKYQSQQHQEIDSVILPILSGQNAPWCSSCGESTVEPNYKIMSTI